MRLEGVATPGRGASSQGGFCAQSVQPVVLLVPAPVPGAAAVFASPVKFNVSSAKQHCVHEGRLAQALAAASPGGVLGTRSPPSPGAAAAVEPEEEAIETPHSSVAGPPPQALAVGGYPASQGAAMRPRAKHARSLLTSDWADIVGRPQSEWHAQVNSALYRLITPLKLVISDPALEERVKVDKEREFLKSLRELQQYRNLLALVRSHPHSAAGDAAIAAALTAQLNDSVHGVVRSSGVLRNGQASSLANFVYHRGRDAGMAFSAQAACAGSTSTPPTLAAEAATAAALLNDAFDRPKDRSSGQPSIFEWFDSEADALAYVGEFWFDTYAAATPELRAWMEAFLTWQTEPRVQSSCGYREGWYEHVKQAVLSCKAL